MCTCVCRFLTTDPICLNRVIQIIYLFQCQVLWAMYFKNLSIIWKILTLLLNFRHNILSSVGSSDALLFWYWQLVLSVCFPDKTCEGVISLIKNFKDQILDLSYVLCLSHCILLLLLLFLLFYFFGLKFSFPYKLLELKA